MELSLAPMTRPSTSSKKWWGTNPERTPSSSWQCATKRPKGTTRPSKSYYSQLSQLNRCIRTYPKYYEAYIYRGKLYLKLKQYRNAVQDFDKAITLDGNKQIGYVGKGDCLRLMEKYDEAKHYYSIAFNNKKNNVSLLLRRAICNMEIRRYEAALEDINKLLETDSENSEAYYFKGLIFSKLSTPHST